MIVKLFDLVCWTYATKCGGLVKRIEITHAYEGFSINPSCIYNDVHKGSQSVPFVPTHRFG